MAKQGEIRESVIVNITKACPDMLNRDIVLLADKILKDEDSQGVVIKVEKPIPPCPNQPADDNRIEDNFVKREEWIVCRDQLLRAGLVAVESLIEEK